MNDRRLLKVEVASCKKCPMYIEDRGNILCSLTEGWLDDETVNNGGIDSKCPLEIIEN